MRIISKKTPTRLEGRRNSMGIVNLSNGTQYRFAVYEAEILNKNNELFTYRFIVIKNEYNLVISFTGLEKYSGKYTSRQRFIESREKHELEYICKVLNYLLFTKYSLYKVDKVSQITKDMIFDFFEHYRSKCIGKGRFPGQQSVNKCIRVVTEEWYKRNEKSDKIFKIYTPVYRKKSLEKTKMPLLRDIPFKALSMLINEAYIHDPDIAFAIIAGSCAGVRPGEAMNIRREDSPLGPGIKLEYIGIRINRIEIDLTHEYLLRSDGKKTGKIKKERIVTVYPALMAEFLNAYKKHLYFCKDREYEKEYGPMFINRDGKAMTYKTYLQRFQNLVRNHLRPQLLKSEDPQLQIFGQRLLTQDLSPHALRHYFSVILALNEDISQIMFYRGDSSPESALDYFQNKGELIRAAGFAHEEALEGLVKIGEIIKNEPEQ